MELVIRQIVASIWTRYLANPPRAQTKCLCVTECYANFESGPRACQEASQWGRGDLRSRAETNSFGTGVKYCRPGFARWSYIVGAGDLRGTAPACAELPPHASELASCPRGSPYRACRCSHVGKKLISPTHPAKLSEGPGRGKVMGGDFFLCFFFFFCFLFFFCIFTIFCFFSFCFFFFSVFFFFFFFFH
jgi:hypothetical protein